MGNMKYIFVNIHTILERKTLKDLLVDSLSICIKMLKLFFFYIF